MNFFKKVLSNMNPMKPKPEEQTLVDDEINKSMIFKNISALNEDTDIIDEEINEVNATDDHLNQDPIPKESVFDVAQSLREQAERARLEAEKMDLLLTMDKITKIERQLVTVKDPKQVEVLSSQIEKLKAKLSADGTNKNQTVITGTITSGSIKNSDSKYIDQAILNSDISSDDIQEIVKAFEKAPPFMQTLVKKISGHVNGESMNITNLAEKMIRDDRAFQRKYMGGYSKQRVSSSGKPASSAEDFISDSDFTQEQIDEIVDVLKIVPQFMKKLYPENIRNNDTAIALIMLKDEWIGEGKRPSYIPTQDEIVRKIEKYKWLPTFVKGDNETAFALEMIEAEQRLTNDKQMGIESDDDDEDEVNEEEEAMNQTMVATFPKRMRKEGKGPTESIIKTILTDVLAKENIWTTSGRPEKVLGGYIIRGSTKFDKGDDLVNAIQRNLSKKSLDTVVRIFYIADPTPITKEEQLDEDRNPVLLVTDFDVSPESSPILLYLTSAISFGTLWYTAIYPCLLNENVQKLVEEQLALADSSMVTNFESLDNMVSPIFFASLAIQVSHELAHRLFASMNGLNVTFPTLVPSLVTGITSAITSLKTPVRNKQMLFDFALSGPLTGMIVSIASIFLGLIFMQSMDTALTSTLPALPVQFLRQSSLGGGIIDSFFPGLLSIPSGSEASVTMSSININLHPLVIAGFLGLQLNAVSLLPIGSK